MVLQAISMGSIGKYKSLITDKLTLLYNLKCVLGYFLFTWIL